MRIENRIVGGVKQYFSVYDDNLEKPILLYLHGGPADSCIPLVEKFNKNLSNEYILVILEQRGAGLSYYQFKNDETLSIQTFIDDAYELALHLLSKYNKEKLYLLGHSWGSVLGIEFIKQHPNIVEKYFGCGQVINMQENFEKQIEFVQRHSKDKKVLNRVATIKQECQSDNWINALLFLTKEIVKLGGSLYGKSNMNSLVYPFIFSKHYKLKDLLNRQKGSMQGIEFFWKELMEVDFTTITNLEVPVVLLEGKSDFHVSVELATLWYDKLESEKTFYLFEKSGHFPQWEESEKFNSVIIKEK